MLAKLPTKIVCFFVPGNWLPSYEGPCSFASLDFSSFAFDSNTIRVSRANVKY
jgi:hypothetical protein